MIGTAWSCEVLYLVHKALIKLSMYRLSLYVNLLSPMLWIQLLMTAKSPGSHIPQVVWNQVIFSLSLSCILHKGPSLPTLPSNVYKITTHSVSASISNFCPPRCHNSQSEVFTSRGADCSEHQLITADHHTPWFLTNLEPRPDCSR